MNTWETLLARALVILRSAASAGSLAREWSLGGGTALMLRHQHRRSEDIDIFVPDPQVLGLLTPRLNPVAESLTPDYAEGATYVKLYFPEGQIDFVVSRHVTPVPVTRETLIGRDIPLETTAEVLGKKLWHRADMFTARDFFDLAYVARAEPRVTAQIEHILEFRAEALAERMESRTGILQEQYEALDTTRAFVDFDECLGIVRELLKPLRKAPGARQEMAAYAVWPSGRLPLPTLPEIVVCP
ncbi:MAG: nucleotidyl transferase AbiEii/AbiGii toxin family protein [Betaproteobacteria bacterium]